MKEAAESMFRKNPVYQMEVGTYARASRVFWLIIAFNCVLSIITFVMFYTAFNGVSNMGAVDYDGLIKLYTSMAYIEFGMVMLIIPATTAGAITGERERKTLDIMLVGNRHARTIVIGKFMANMRLIFIVMLSSIPIISMVFVYGGIKFVNLLQLFAIIMVAGAYIGSIGIFCSSVCKKTTSAIMMAYAAFIGLTILTVALNYLFARVTTGNGYLGEYYMLYLNPIAPITHLISEQFEIIGEFEQLIFYGISQEILDNIMGKWVIYSSLVQLAVSAILLIVSTLILNPLKFNYLRRFLKAYVNGEKTAED